MKTFDTHRLVKSEDLNHHGSLFAGRSAEWFVESGFIAATSYVNPRNLICFKIHGMCFLSPIRLGEIVCLRSRIAHAGRTSIIAYIEVFKDEAKTQKIVDGYITFVCVDDNTKSMAHGVVIEAVTEEEKVIQEGAMKLGK